MKRLVIALAVSAAALVGGSAANAASNDVKAKADRGVSQSTDISSQHRHHHGNGHRHHHGHGYYRPHHGHGYYRPHHRHGYYRPYYNSYGYQRPYGYYGGGPGISFSFGSGGYRGW
jgi:Ni/Co efflux regulator RcnB